MAELKGIIQVIAKTGTGFVITGTEGWFNIKDKSVLSKFNKGDEVYVTYEVDGKQKKVSMISSVGPKECIPPVETKKEPTPEFKKEASKLSSTGFACEVCGKELKDGKFKKCYECNVAAKATPVIEEQKVADSNVPKCIDCGAVLKNNKYTKCYPCNLKNPVQKKQWKPKTGEYDSPEKQAAILKGNSLNAAASVLCGASCLDGKDPDEIAQITQYVAHLLLDYLKQD